MNLDLTHFPSARHVAGAALVSCITFLSACSDDRPNRVPIGSTLSISPTERTWTIFDRRDEEGRCFIDPDDYVDQPMLIGLRDGGGVPFGDVEIGVYVDLAENTYSGFPVLQLYEDLNSNGVVDGDSELVSGADDEIARVRLSKYGGEHLMILRANLSCPYRSEVFAFIDGYSALTSVEVTVREKIDLPEPAE